MWGQNQAVGSAPHQPHVLCNVCVHHTFPGLPPHCLLLLCAAIPAAFAEVSAFFPLGAVYSQVLARPWALHWDSGTFGTYGKPCMRTGLSHSPQTAAFGFISKKKFSSWQLLTQKKYLANLLQNYLFLSFFFKILQ